MKQKWAIQKVQVQVQKCKVQKSAKHLPPNSSVYYRTLGLSVQGNVFASKNYCVENEISCVEQLFVDFRQIRDGEERGDDGADPGIT